MTRVAIITNVLAHYRVRGFEKLARHPAIDVSYFLLADRMPHRDYIMTRDSHDLPVTVLPGWRISRQPADDWHINTIRPVLQGAFDTVIIGGWDEATYLMLWAACIMTGKRVLFWIESTAYDYPRTWLKETVKRWMLSMADGCITPGQRAAQYCMELGVPRDRIYTAPNAADSTLLQSRAQTLAHQREDIRQSLGLTGCVILFVGRLVEKYKHVSCLLEAYSKLKAQYAEAMLVIIGGGPDEPAYRQYVSDNNLKDVIFKGTLDQAAIFEYYAASDTLVLPSQSETWGFALNEGMAFGLPVVVSESVGAGPDLVIPGENGVIFPTGDAQALADALAGIADNESLRTSMRARSREIIAGYTPDAWVDGVIHAVLAGNR